MGERTEELKTLEIIYPELKVNREDSAHIELSITLTEPLHIFAGSAPQHHRTVTHLPPISIDCSLPEHYPSDAPPLVKLGSTTSWLPVGVAKDLEAAAATLWEDYGHCEILFAYISHVQEAVGKSFGLDQLALSPDCFNELIKYDRQTARDEFKKGSHVCTICLTPKPGPKCYRMEHCGHIFCVECLQEYYNTTIESGDVHNVQCLSPNCGTEGIDVRARRTKKIRHISPRELLQIPLERDIVQRYVDMKRKKRLEADKATIWCPRKWCHGAAKGSRYPKPTVPIEEMNGSDTEDEDVMVPAPTQASSTPPDVNEDAENHRDPLKHGDRLSICEDCGLAFCNICRLTWHGELTWCYPDFRKNPRIIAEEQASLDYIATHTSPCPGVRGAEITALRLAEKARQQEQQQQEQQQQQQQRAQERREHFERLARERQERFEQQLSKRASN